MSLVKWAFIVVILLPVAEFAVFVAAALTIGWVGAAALFVATSVAGLAVLRRTGRRDLDRLRDALSARGLRAVNLETPGLASLIAGILLVLPGFITDVAGAMLLLPPLRRRLAAAVGGVFQMRRAARDPAVIDLSPGEWRQVSESLGEEHECIPPRGRKRGS